MPKGRYQRVIKTVIPDDGIFKFSSRARREGKAEKQGLRFTVPPAVIRGLQQLGWNGGNLVIRVNHEPPFIGRARMDPHSRATLSIPKENRPAYLVDDVPICVELRNPRSRVKRYK